MKRRLLFLVLGALAVSLPSAPTRSACALWASTRIARAARASQLGVALFDSMDEVLPIADFITVHVPRTDGTYHMFAAEQFAQMKDGVVIVNTARGGVVIDEKALSDFMAAGRVFACGIDMLEAEPSAETPLAEFDRAVLTPHLGANTLEAQMRAGVNIARYVANGLEGLVVPTVVNMVSKGRSTRPLPPIFPHVRCAEACSRSSRAKFPKALSIVASGSCAGDMQVLSAATLSGMLSREGQASVSTENADASARRHGIKMEAQQASDSRGYDSIVSMEADGLEISATVPGVHREVHVVSILGYRLDVVPGDHALIFTYADEPGQVGRMGTILGEGASTSRLWLLASAPIAARYLCSSMLKASLRLRLLSESRRRLMRRIPGRFVCKPAMVLFVPWGAVGISGHNRFCSPCASAGHVMDALHHRIMCIFLLRRALLFRVIEYQAGIFAMFDIVDAYHT